MAYLGKFQDGDSIPLMLDCVDNNGLPTIPDADGLIDASSINPEAVILDAAGNTIATVKLAAVFDDVTSAGAFQGFFKRRYRIDSTAGGHTILYRYTLSGTTFFRDDTFELVTGGDAKGTIIALDYMPQHGQSVIQYDTESGTIQIGRNPT